MSRVGKNPILMPKGIDAVLNEKVLLLKKGVYDFKFNIPSFLDVSIKSDKIYLSANDSTKVAKAMWGTLRSLIYKKIKGMSAPFEQVINLVGVGYKAELGKDSSGEKLTFSLGYSHPVVYYLPTGVSAKILQMTQIVLQSHDNQLLGQVVSNLKNLRDLDPYKGKGILPEGHFVLRKEHKKK